MRQICFLQIENCTKIPIYKQLSLKTGCLPYYFWSSHPLIGSEYQINQISIQIIIYISMYPRYVYLPAFESTTGISEAQHQSVNPLDQFLRQNT